MLETLRIQNYALIDTVEIDFRGGLNALTGETGAGKSILVGALNLVLGARAAGDVIREGADRASIDAVFRLPHPSPRLRRILADHGITLEEGELFLSRTLSADGRTRASVGGVLTPVGVLAEIGDELVDLHGQHEHQSLLKPDRQLDLLDAFAETEEDAARTAAAVAEMHALEREIVVLETDDRERARQIDFMRFEMQEIDGAGFAPGEEEELRGRLNLITNAETVYTLAGHIYGLIYENEGQAAIDLLGAAGRDLDALAAIDERFRPLAQQLGELCTGAEAIASEIRSYTDGVDFDADELERINQRLTLLRDLKRKYGASIGEILAHRSRAAAQVEAFEQRDERLAEMRTRLTRLCAEAQEQAGALSKKRAAAAKRLDKRVTDALQDLGMKGGRFQTSLERVSLCAQGVDRVEFQLSANPGERIKPLRQVASGGEISRIMLALKAVFADADRIPTLIFDEIDAGVGGAVARKVAEKLRALAASHQIICITHIPQIAAVAQAHFRVEKEARQKRTSTSVREVRGDARVEEVARLLDGTAGAVSMEHARVLLDEQGAKAD